MTLFSEKLLNHIKWNRGCSKWQKMCGKQIHGTEANVKVCLHGYTFCLTQLFTNSMQTFISVQGDILEETFSKKYFFNITETNFDVLNKRKLNP